MAKTRSGRKRRGGEGTSQRLKEREAKLLKMRDTRKQGKNDEAAEVHKALASLDRRLSAEEKGRTAAAEETFGFPAKKSSSGRKASSRTVYGFPSSEPKTKTKTQKRTGRLKRFTNYIFGRNKNTNKKTVKRNSGNNPFSSVRRTNPMYTDSPTNSAKQRAKQESDIKAAEFGEMLYRPSFNKLPSPTGKKYTAAEAAAAAGMPFGPY
jgi:hypothetical protein